MIIEKKLIKYFNSQVRQQAYLVFTQTIIVLKLDLLGHVVELGREVHVAKLQRNT